MVNYHVVHLKVSPAQGKKMLQGESVRFKLSDMENGDVPVPVLKSHISRMMKAYKSGKGFVLQPLSASHRRYMIDGKHGDGFFSDLWSGIKSIGKKIIDNPVVRAIAKPVLKVVKNLPVVKNVIDEAESVANSLPGGLNLGTKARKALDDYAGSGMKRKSGVAIRTNGALTNG